MSKKTILFISSECAPFAKTGGLADVVGALPIQLKRDGHDVFVVMPKYSFLKTDGHTLETVHTPMSVWMGNQVQEWCSISRTYTTADVPVYFVDFNRYFFREDIYHDKMMNDYSDNPRRFAFLTRAALQMCIDLDIRVDIVHVHDWPTAIAGAYIKTWHWQEPALREAATVLTIHNLAYQGVYPRSHYGYIGLGEEHFHTHAFEAYGGIALLKGGIHFADAVNTVSPNYAWETRTPELGQGLAMYLNNKGDSYTGILNGVDYDEWNPETDTHLPANFSSDDLSGKAICKAELQRTYRLTVDPDIPVIGVVSRFVAQKGLDLLAQTIEGIVNTMSVQFAILGSGDKGLEHYFAGLPDRYPGRIGSYIGYHGKLSHWIEAGSDFFVMPSYFEPCGLNQIYSLRYGTLPIVRATGGLDDTVENYNEQTGDGTGFKFWSADAHALYSTIAWAVSTYHDRKHHMDMLIQRAMKRNFSWEKSARAYEALYDQAIANKRTYDSWFR